MDRPIHAIAVGRLVPIKNFDVVLNAWIDVSSQLQIVGGGPLHDKLVRQAEGLGLLDRVQFLGERDDVPELMANSDLLVSASSREGFSYVVLEALRARLVVVSTSTGIASDLVPQDYLVDEPSAELLRSVIGTTLASFDQARTDFASAWEASLELTVDQMIRGTEAVYSATINDLANDRSRR